jgi:hypothetical protein
LSSDDFSAAYVRSIENAHIRQWVGKSTRKCRNEGTPLTWKKHCKKDALENNEKLAIVTTLIST